MTFQLANFYIGLVTLLLGMSTNKPNDFSQHTSGHMIFGQNSLSQLKLTYPSIRIWAKTAPELEWFW